LSWNGEYSKDRRIWGEEPSVLAQIMLSYLLENGFGRDLSLLDIGCGYGRDSIYLAKSLGCHVYGIDVSEKALEIAKGALAESGVSGVEFQLKNFKELGDHRYDVVFASNLYHLIDKADRGIFRDVSFNILKSGGLLFLNAISSNDLEHWGKGISVPDESNTFMDGKYIHLSTRNELASDFSLLRIIKLYEHRYREVHASGIVHNHISWILIGTKRPQ
jgi:cyclopropane fatty-acyl-phospholipid synthase-like methyltransferase